MNQPTNSTSQRYPLSQLACLESRGQIKRPIVYIHSKHPLAQRTIHSALYSDRRLRDCIRMVSDVASISPDAPSWVPVIDTCSEENWAHLVSKWTVMGGLPIVLVSEQQTVHEEHLRILYLGVRGIVTMSSELDKQLRAAVRSIIAGNLWISRRMLHEYLRRTSSLFVRLQGQRKFTAREEQIVRFIITGFSNRQIGSVLSISERTVKFHVSNILQKAQAESRADILELLKTA